MFDSIHLVVGNNFGHLLIISISLWGTKRRRNYDYFCALKTVAICFYLGQELAIYSHSTLIIYTQIV